jgi:hypothetical protein
MILTLSYTYDSFYADCKELSEMEAVTIAQMPKEQGFISQDVNPVLGAMEERDTTFLKDKLKFYAAEFYLAIRGWLDTDTPLTIDDTGIEFLFKDNAVSEANAPIITQMVEKALQYGALAQWYSRFFNRQDISEKYGKSYEALKSNARSILIQKVERPYRFH